MGDPRHIIRGLHRKERIPKTLAEKQVYVRIHGAKALSDLDIQWFEGEASPSVDYALELFNNEEQRIYIEACLIASNDFSQVAKSFRMKAEEIADYHNIFFDTQQFRNDLEILSYIKKRIEKGTPTERTLLDMAYHQGLSAIVYHFSRSADAIDSMSVLQNTLRDAYYRSLAHKGRGISHKTTKEAMKWAHMATTTARTIATIDEPEEKDSTGLRFQFEEEASTISVDDLEDRGVKVIH